MLRGWNHGYVFKWVQYRFGVDVVVGPNDKEFTRQASGTEGARPDFNLKRAICRWCRQKFPSSAYLSAAPNTESISMEQAKRCPTCGWSASTMMWTDSTGENRYYREPGEQAVIGQQLGEHAVLRKFSINDGENVSLAEAGTFLKRHFSDAARLSPRRMEELVEDVFKQLGYRTRLTAQSRDGGADIVFLDADGGVEAIIEVKRYANAVGIALVQRLVGAMHSFSTKRAYLVTTSRFTSPARQQVALVTRSGYSLELWDGERLLRELDVYREPLPELELIDPQRLPRVTGSGAKKKLKG